MYSLNLYSDHPIFSKTFKLSLDNRNSFCNGFLLLKATINIMKFYKPRWIYMIQIPCEFRQVTLNWKNTLLKDIQYVVSPI